MELVELLIWVVSGGGAGVVSYWLWGELEKIFPDGLGEWSSRGKRYSNLALAALLGAAAYGAGVMMGYEPTPEDTRSWIEAIFSSIALSVSLSQIVHGQLEL